MNNRPPEFLFGESAGRIEVPLSDLPPGVKAFTVPKRRADDELELGAPVDRVPRDNKGRPKVRRVDLLPDAQSSSFALPATLTKRDLIWVLDTNVERRWSGVVSQFGDQAWEATMELVRSGVAVVRCAVDGFDYRPQHLRLTEGWQAARLDHLNELRGRPDPDTARAELHDLTANVADLADERLRLEAVERGTPLRVPAGSRSGTTVWSVYEDAIRAACYWYLHDGANAELTAKHVASHAFRGSKRWTPEREAAFANIVNMSFTDAVKVNDVEILMRGPLLWHVGSVVADAHTSQPWIGLPAGGLALLGTVDTAAVRGVLVIENKDTFEEVCLQTNVYNRWLCVWGKGYASRPLVAFLSGFAKVPIAAWCDLDADGIGIINNLTVRLDRHVEPVCMDVESWQAGPYRRQTTSELQRGRARATALAAEGPTALRPLAAAIAPNGEGREQESMHNEVLPTLPSILSNLEGHA
ncbi:Wadjet anti-phage system protein JetD domain-containing protein [Lentzea sp. E54]|uniref:Wadjet anti-phage system protein JetD domain-containing protein n=1 Tax=Lentzea xerophila TaxID=3435883 RepID=UPI003DA356E0